MSSAAAAAAVLPRIDLSVYTHLLTRTQPIRLAGKIAQIVGLVAESSGTAARVGDLCRIHSSARRVPVLAEVVGFREDRTLLMPLGDMAEVGPGSEVVNIGRPLMAPVGRELLGRVLDGLGRPLDGNGPLHCRAERKVDADPPNPLNRVRISEPLALGIRALDALMTCGKGQRVGIFSGSGVGKSTLLGMVARNTSADVNVIALIGERGREVRDFIEEELGEEGLARSVLVVATSDRPALIRLKGALLATTIAEYFRDQGLDVMLMMDSITRFAWAQREVGLAVGEPPTTRGYTPSVFSLLPKLLERSGASDRGTITGLYTILVEADDMNEPIADTVRSVLDGHVVLSRDLAARNHFPAIDVLASVSRLAPQITPKECVAAAGKLRETLATYRDAEDLVNIGAYASGSNAEIDFALQRMPALRSFLVQDRYEKSTYAGAVQRLAELMADAPKGMTGATI